MANPLFIPIQFAKNGIKNVIQKVLQSSQDQEDATWNSGWGQITMIPKEDGGLAPKGQDFNGILYTMSDHLVHRQNGQQILFSADVVAEYGGYAKNSIIQSDDGLKHYRSLIDNNTFNPNTQSIANRWEIYAGAGSVPSASSTIAGVIRVINNVGSTDVGAALSANMGKTLNDKFNFTNSKNTNGYVRLGDSGIMLQWGTVDYLSNPGEIQVNVAFPVAFDNACLNISTTRKMNIHSTNGDGGALVVSQSRTGCIISLNNFNSDSITNLRGFTWFAIGY